MPWYNLKKEGGQLGTRALLQVQKASNSRMKRHRFGATRTPIHGCLLPSFCIPKSRFSTAAEPLQWAEPSSQNPNQQLKMQKS